MELKHIYNVLYDCVCVYMHMLTRYIYVYTAMYYTHICIYYIIVSMSTRIYDHILDVIYQTIMYAHAHALSFTMQAAFLHVLVSRAAVTIDQRHLTPHGYTHWLACYVELYV